MPRRPKTTGPAAPPPRSDPRNTLNELHGAATAKPPRRAVGIEVSPKWVKVYHAVAADVRKKGVEAIDRQGMVQGDCLEELERFPADHFDFIVTDPPYNVHFKITMSVGKQGKYKEFTNRRTDYDMKSDDARDFANLGGYAAYLDAMER